MTHITLYRVSSTPCDSALPGNAVPVYQDLKNPRTEHEEARHDPFEGVDERRRTQGTHKNSLDVIDANQRR